MIQYLLLITPMLSFLFSSFYECGDIINTEHQNIPIEICYGTDEEIGTTMHLGEHNEGIIVLGLASWG
tara:strand:+ start:120 stop:323 length:204 start_codon:yes stop_codon:yes gene_type:complete